MTSEAREDLLLRLKDIDEIYEAHKSITGGGRGRPAERRGAALTRAGTVLLAAALQAFVEDLFKEAAAFILAGNTEDERKDLFKQVVKPFGNANIHNTNMLFFNLGIPWVCNDIRWRNCSNTVVKSKINKLVDARNKVAHGHSINLNLQMLMGWKETVKNFSDRFEAKIGKVIAETTGNQPQW